MKRLLRLALRRATEDYLAERQREVDAGADAEAAWRTARGSRHLENVVSALKTMTGKRERCMYCWDSRCTDIEHFWPKSKYPEKTFVWTNLLMTCCGCNREKGADFELDSDGLPLLLNPVDADPWEHLYFDSRTGLVTPRFLNAAQDPRGAYTIQVIQTLVCEACVEGRLRTYRNLVRAVKRFERSYDSPDAEDELLAEIADNDGHGLATWFFVKYGQEEPPFCRLRDLHPRTWARLHERIGQPAAGD